MMWWRYIDNIFLFGEHGEQSLEKILNKLNSFHLTIKFKSYLKIIKQEYVNHVGRKPI